MICTRRPLLRGLALLLFLILPALRCSAAQTFRQIEMGNYTVLTNASSERKVTAWMEKFDLQRRAAQQLIGLEDRQVLRLTVLLLEKDRDFLELIGDRRMQMQSGHAPELVVQSVGLARQPMIALSIESGFSGSEMKIRSVLAMWLLSSSGVIYDPWVVQGFLHFFQEANIRSNWLTVGQSNRHNVEELGNNREQFQFTLASGALPPAMAWLAFYHLTIKQGEWQGFGNLAEYQQRVTEGTSRAEAFAQVFGQSPADASEAMMRRLKSMDFGVVRIPSDVRHQEAEVALREAPPGVWDLNKARFMVQKPGANQELAMAFLTQATALLPADDPGPEEVRWLNALATNQTGLAGEVLAKAIKAGTKNDTMRLQWCMDTINLGIRTSGGVMVPADKALLVADMLQAVAANNPRQLATYRLLADVIPSVSPAREQDRQTLVKARETLRADDEIIQLGLIAWRWRNGELPAAGREMKAFEPGPEATAFVKSYADWLRAQLGAEERLLAYHDAVSRGKFLEAGAVFNGIQAQYTLVPHLAEDYRAARLELQYFNLTVQAQDYLANDNPDAAKVLLEEMSGVELAPNLREIVDAMLNQIRENK